MKKFLCLIWLPLIMSCCAKDKHSTIITTAFLHVELGTNKNGVPYISNISSVSTGKQLLCDDMKGRALQTRLENGLLTGGKAKLRYLSGWETEEDSVMIKAKAAVSVGEAKVTVHVDVMKGSSLFTTYCRIQAKDDVQIETFPIFGAGLRFSEDTMNLCWWKALEFTPQQQVADADTRLVLQSRIHSSDNTNGVAGNVPFWCIQKTGSSLGFSLGWCGGWTAEFSGKDDFLQTDVYLPGNETQLTLQKGEEVAGPELVVFLSEATDPMQFRNQWQAARSELAGTRYPSPVIQFPLIYNHWYAVEFNLSESFVKNQVKWFEDYGFDVFMIDAGWYKNVGAWTPHPGKFSPAEFVRSVNTIKHSGARVGLWSCPHLMALDEPLPDFIDQPGRFVPFMNAWLVDYNKMDFAQYLNRHLDTLSNQLGAEWWKFDQEYFALKPRSGKLRSVLAFQEAFSSARKTYPNLIFEACQGGGKMINEFTDQISQIHWIRDGERTGYVHALTNIYEALGAAGFLELQKVQRWNNRIDETDMTTPEPLKFYCRSCMIGSWGISADLNRIDTDQKSVVLGEISNYRRLNRIKKDNYIDCIYPGEYTSLVPVAFYDKSLQHAGILFYRLFPRDQEVRMKLKTRLDPSGKYRVEDVDRKTVSLVEGNEIELILAPGQLSAIYFISPENKQDP